MPVFGKNLTDLEMFTTSVQVLERKRSGRSPASVPQGLTLFSAGSVHCKTQVETHWLVSLRKPRAAATSDQLESSALLSIGLHVRSVQPLSRCSATLSAIAQGAICIPSEPIHSRSNATGQASHKAARLCDDV